ncbi:hypothetical protein EVAR_62785_1 [Eumeta japonica]|uniref:Uncharacterized protein n=1 Tax=Eumeta variegata TaxID=151549 RepID=A0A4C1Z5T2_EUMVA|nr:hypothetical protein EVAR_62785_1 [Eumeta japonica]
MLTKGSSYKCRGRGELASYKSSRVSAGVLVQGASSEENIHKSSARKRNGNLTHRKPSRCRTARGDETNETSPCGTVGVLRGRPIIVEWERDARHSAGLSRSVTHRYVTERYTFS